jgi:hypothetical protein
MKKTRRAAPGRCLPGGSIRGAAILDVIRYPEENQVPDPSGMMTTGACYFL